MKKRLNLVIGALLVGAYSSSAMAAEVEDFSGTYDMSCESAKLVIQVASGIGEVNQSANAVLANVEGDVFTHEIDMACSEDGASIEAPEALSAGIIAHCEDNLIIPASWNINCQTIADESVKWAEMLSDNLSKGLIDEYSLTIESPRNWFERWLGIHPSSLEVTRVNGAVRTTSPTVSSSGKFSIDKGLRYPVLAGLNGFSCIGGLVDNSNGQLNELADSVHESTAKESNEAGIICSQTEDEQTLAVGVTIDLQTTYRGEKTAY